MLKKNVFSKNRIEKTIILGDLNIAPYEKDVWSHKQLLKVVSYTPIERKYLKNLLDDGNWVDVVRYNNLPDTKLFSWWSYRSKNWEISNKGRRLYHIFSSNDCFAIFIKTSRFFLNFLRFL